MLYRMTNGNNIKQLVTVLKGRDFYLSLNKVCTNDKLILATPLMAFDILNSISTPKSLIYKPSGYLFKFFISSLMVVWARIVFKGKGFRIRNFQKERKLTFNFGRSHWTKLKFIRLWFFWKIKRQNYMVVSYSSISLVLFKLFFPHIKLVNRYTMRGLRLRQQKIVRRFGKISQYISSLH